MVFLELRREASGSSRIEMGPSVTTLIATEKSGLFLCCEGHVGIPLESLPANRPVSRIQSGNSVFLSGSDRDLRLPIKVQLGSQASPGVEAWDSAFLLSCQGVSGLWSSSSGEFGLFQEHRQGRQATHLVVRGYSVFHWSKCSGIRTYLEQRGNSVSFLLAAGSPGFHWRFNR